MHGDWKNRFKHMKFKSKGKGKSEKFFDNINMEKLYSVVMYIMDMCDASCGGAVV